MRPEVSQAAELLQRGDASSVERALELLQQTVFAFSMKVCGHREDAEDTAQDVLLKSATKLLKVDGPKALVVWLYTVAKNQCLMRRRKSVHAPKQTLSLDDLLPDREQLQALATAPSLDPEHLFLDSQKAELLRQAVQLVPEQYRLILVLHDMEELPTEEIAQITGLQPGTVRVRLHRGRLFVRNELAKHGLFRTGAPRTASRHDRHDHDAGRCKELFAALSDYLDERLDPEMCERMRNHLEGCAPCEVFISTLEQTVDELKHYTPDRPSAAKLKAAIREKYREAAAQLPTPPRS